MDRRQRHDDELASEYRSELERQPWPRRDCPSTDALERLLLDTSNDAERASLADHLATCAGCADLVRDLRSLDSWAERAKQADQGKIPLQISRAGTVRRLSRLWPAALAASLLVMIGAVSVWTWNSARPPLEDPLRGPTQAVSPAPGAELAEFPEIFEWTAQLGATAYRLELFDSAGDPLWHSDWQTEPRCSMPASLVIVMEPRGTYTWSIAVRGDVPRSRLGPYGFEVANDEAPPRVLAPERSE